MNQIINQVCNRLAELFESLTIKGESAEALSECKKIIQVLMQENIKNIQENKSKEQTDAK